MPPCKRPASSDQPQNHRASKRTREDHPPYTTPSVFSPEQISSISQAVAATVAKTLADSNPSQAVGPSIQFVPDPQSTIGPSPSSNPTDSTGNSDGLVQASASEVLGNITRGVVKPQENATSSKNPFISASVSLAQRVSDKVRNKVWANECVDFSTQFHTQDSEGQYILKFFGPQY